MKTDESKEYFMTERYAITRIMIMRCKGTFSIPKRKVSTINVFLYNKESHIIWNFIKLLWIWKKKKFMWSYVLCGMIKTFPLFVKEDEE